MNEIDLGHKYQLDSYDGGSSEELTFMKREGTGYPFNVGHHSGTNCQEVIRVLIARVKYLQSQIPCHENVLILGDLRNALWLFEKRAALRHNLNFILNAYNIETFPTCKICGHISCPHQETML